MTGKRFNVFDVDGTIFLEDHKEGSYHIGEIGNVDVDCLNDITDRLNELHEEKNYFERKKCEYWNKFNLAHLDNINLRKENEQLKEQIADLENSFDICKHYKETYGDEIVHIKHTIKDMLENERTELGRSVLKQLWEAIQ